MTAAPRIPADLRAAGERCRVKRRPPPAPPRTAWERLQIAAGFGCFHTLASDRRPAYVIGVSHVAAGLGGVDEAVVIAREDRPGDKRS
jgi:hypothetical protein